jgi:acetyl-CoA carboxylase biotin carboxyl carrier protein
MSEPFDFEEVKNFSSFASNLFSELSLTHLRLKYRDTEIELDRSQTIVPASFPVPPANLSVQTSDSPSQTADSDDSSDVIKAPLLGVFYAAPSPDSDAYVNVGDRVKKGDVVCVIEAMKMMNEITADCDCTITEVIAQNGKVVEFGQKLFKIKK